MHNIDSTPLISVAMCTYNGARYLEAQLDSILNQSYPNLEIVVVDDASSDGTVELLRTYAQRDARIKLQVNESNLGFVGNFRKALSLCGGDYIALADQDDVWLPQKIDTLYREIEDAWLIYSRVGVIDDQGRALTSIFPKTHRLQGQCALSLLLGNCVTGHASFLRRELLDLAMPALAAMPYHDQWLAIVAASQGKLKASEAQLSLYRRHGGNAVLARKGRSNLNRRQKLQRRTQSRIDFFEAVLASRILSPHEQDLACQLLLHYRKNSQCIYNWSLHGFLKKYEDPFLALYQAPRRQRRNLCRGIGYFRLLPFA